MTANAAGKSGNVRGGLLPAGRKADLVSYVTESGQVSVAELADRFGVSADTIRRDLDSLDAQGVVIRTHGGAVSTSLVPRADTGTDVRARLHPEAKRRIGEKAAEYVTDGASVIINGGTTTLEAVEHLRAKRLRIVTNNLLLPTRIAESSVDEIFFVGGPVRAASKTTVGPLSSALGTERAGDFGVHCDVALIGVGAVSVKQGFSTSDLAEAQLMRDMLHHADKVVVLADSWKFGRSLFARVGELDAADVVVTDEAPGADIAEALTAAGVSVQVVSERSAGGAAG